MVAASNAVPKIFFKLAAQARNTDELSENMITSFLAVNTVQESFIPEVVALVGEKDFVELIKLLGGKTIKIPTVTDILTSFSNSE